MSVTIQDDMMAAAAAMPRKQADAFIVALVRYGMSGEEPKGSPAWLPTFITCKDRIELSTKAMNKGKRMAEARWHKHDAQASDKHDAQASNKHDAQASCISIDQASCTSIMHEHDTENEKEREKEKEESEESPQASAINAQVAEVIEHLNEVCGTSYRPNAKSSRECIGARLKDGFTVEDCKRVIDNMASRWLNSERMRPYLRPDTLFRPTKFESYLNTPPAGASPLDPEIAAYI